MRLESQKAPLHILPRYLLRSSFSNVDFNRNILETAVSLQFDGMWSLYLIPFLDRYILRLESLKYRFG